MIEHSVQIRIDSSPEAVFSLIETMPNKFPVYRVLETKPVFFLRLLFVGGLRAAIDATSVHRSEDQRILRIGDSMGPFTLTKSEKPSKYWFDLKSLFFNCRTGYSLAACGGNTILELDIIAENPSPMERAWWFLIKPIHGVLARKVLRIIKESAERRG